ncbi:MAG: 3-ketoacyl-ACP reductase [Acidobacteria bacterium]|nr:MAG: 3-ketoacyl-ACP reductase [Acidobacteriota bacterium]
MNANRVALITGASRGIGRAIALALAECRFDLVINYQSNLEAAQSVQSQASLYGTRAVVCPADISQKEGQSKLIDFIKTQFGRIDVLVNNAGVAPAVREDMLHASEESFDRLIAINLKGPYFLTQRIAQWMIAQRQQLPEIVPIVINISSISAYTSSTNRADYCISKAGISMMTRLYADRLAEFGISVFEIRPGLIATDMTSAVKEKYDPLIAQGLTPIRRWGRPEDVGKAVIAIVQGYLPFSTGEVINVDGGFHLRRL